MSRIAVAAVAATDQVMAFSSVTGTWVGHSATGLINTDRVAVSGDVATVAVAATDQVPGFSALRQA
jgi:hypothetical protein